MSHPQDLVGTVYPKYFNTAAFGSLINCFTFLTGFDDSFMDFLDVKEQVRPVDLGWTKLGTRDEWISAVNDYFNGSAYDSTCLHNFSYISSSVMCDHKGVHLTPPSVLALCFPLINGASDCHWAVFNGTYWLEQADRGGAINVWASINGLLEAVYMRGDGKYYVQDTHFFFPVRIA